MQPQLHFVTASFTLVEEESDGHAPDFLMSHPRQVVGDVCLLNLPTDKHF